jgi:pSer/pThr/pTyr-binding forkhead associated (FHA) protein
VYLSVTERAATRAVDGGHRTLALEVPDRRMSGQHARLPRASETLWAIEDLDSKDGTRANGATVERRTFLADGDVIEAGSTFFLGNVSRVAEARGKQRTLVHRWITWYGIAPHRYRKERRLTARRDAGSRSRASAPSSRRRRSCAATPSAATPLPPLAVHAVRLHPALPARLAWA